MKVLWFTNTHSCYEEGKHLYHGGGWIESLELLMSKEIDLSVSFFHTKDDERAEKNNVVYYPVLRKSSKRNPFNHIYKAWKGELENEKYIDRFIQIIEECKPDIIHIFGTEGMFGLIQTRTSIPVIIHLQGLVNPIVNSFFPPNTSQTDFLINSNFLFDNMLGRSLFFEFKRFKKRATREQLILMNAKYIIGRTNWDKTIAKIYNKNIQYFHINEVLRPFFYTPIEKNENGQKNKIIITSTLSSSIYKGIDVVLKTASLLICKPEISFEWIVIGLEDKDKLLKYFEKKLRLNHKSLNIKFVGNRKPDELKAIICNSCVFVHPSYIDNSPNSVCEAQILGVPVIACNVGGVSTIVENNLTGKLIPANGVFELTDLLTNFQLNKPDFELLARNAKSVAFERHNTMKIKNQLVRAYKLIKSN